MKNCRYRKIPEGVWKYYQVSPGDVEEFDQLYEPVRVTRAEWEQARRQMRLARREGRVVPCYAYDWAETRRRLEEDLEFERG